MKKLISALFLTTISLSVWAGAQYSVQETNIGTLLNDPQARAVLEKHLPKTISNPQFTMAHGFTLAFIQSFDQVGELTDETLEEIDAELAALGTDEQ